MNRYYVFSFYFFCQIFSSLIASENPHLESLNAQVSELARETGVLKAKMNGLQRDVRQLARDVVVADQQASILRNISLLSNMQCANNQNIQNNQGFKPSKTLVWTASAVVGLYCFSRYRPYATQQDLDQRLNQAVGAVGGQIDQLARDYQGEIVGVRDKVDGIAADARSCAHGAGEAAGRLAEGVGVVGSQQVALGQKLEGHKRNIISVSQQEQGYIDGVQLVQNQAQAQLGELRSVRRSVQRNIHELGTEADRNALALRDRLAQEHAAQGEQLTGLEELAVSLASRLEAENCSDNDLNVVLKDIQELQYAQQSFARELESSDKGIEERVRNFSRGLRQRQEATIAQLEGFIDVLERAQPNVGRPLRALKTPTLKTGYGTQLLLRQDFSLGQ